MPETTKPISAAHIFNQPDALPFKAAITLGQGLPETRGGKPCHHYWKQMLKPGRLQDATGKTVEVPPQRIDTIIRDSRRAKEIGYEPYLPLGSHKAKDKNVGWLVDVQKREDGSLWGLHQFVGEKEEVEKLVACNKSSICTLCDYTDEHGNHYDEIISHNAILPDPRFNDLENFQPALAASRGQAVSVDVLEPAAPDKPETPERSKGMKPELLKRYRDILGAAETTSEEDLQAKLADALEQTRRDKSAAEARVAELDGKVLSLSRSVDDASPAKPTAGELYFASRAVQAEREKAISSGAILSTIADKAEARFMGKAVDSKSISLSRTVEDDDHKLREGYAKLIDFYEVVQGNKPGPEKGAQSGMQFSREVPGGDPKDKEPAKMTEKRRRELLAQDSLGSAILKDESKHASLAAK